MKRGIREDPGKVEVPLDRVTNLHRLGIGPLVTQVGNRKDKGSARGISRGYRLAVAVGRPSARDRSAL